MKRSLDQLAEIAHDAVRIGSDIVKNTRPTIVTEKSKRDTFTNVDIEIEREIRTYLAEKTPELDFTGEEEGDNNQPTTGEYRWMLDPIDGTSNFVHDIPLCAVQLALTRNGEAIVSAIALPYFKEYYSAVSGGGAYRNGSKITVSRTTELSRAIVSIGDYAVGEAAREKNVHRIALTGRLADRVERIRMFGSAAHDFTWLADGRTDALVIMSNNIIDVAPGVLLVKEAGGLVLDIDGTPYCQESSGVFAVGPDLAGELLNIIRNDSPTSIDN